MSDFQIIIPMSGFGERFRRAGYGVPKPLIRIDNKPIIAHVIEMFPGETDFIFVCNREHLDNSAYDMAETLRRHAPKGRIVSVAPHRKGPVHAVLHARDQIDAQRPTIVNYCDFTCYWDWQDFISFTRETGAAGVVPAYRGFHPHHLGSTNYAYIAQNDRWMTDIREKQPFTDDRINEFASSGTYYFDTGARCLAAFDDVVAQALSVNGEYYASLAYRVLCKQKAPVAIYELQHFMQWGTPEDLKTYEGWSNAFRRLAIDDDRRARQPGSVVVPMAGYGKRFVDEGYALPKPLIPVGGRPMVIQATRDLPDAPATRFVLRRDVPQLDQILLKLRTSFVGVSLKVLDEPTDGQAITCLLGLDGLDQSAPLTIGACDNAMLYNPEAFERLLEPGGPDVLVWVVRGHADGSLRPNMFGWVDADDDGRIEKVLVKAAPEDPATTPLIVGAFTFRRAEDYRRVCESLVARNGRVNGEFYIDSLVDDAISLGLDCRIFEIDHYLGWGTPNDLKTFEYWQSCFHKWSSHPYTLERDRRIPTSAVGALADRFRAIRPLRPGEPEDRLDVSPVVGSALKASPDRETLRQGVRFLPVGVAAVLIDLIVYTALLRMGLSTVAAKTISFICGALFAFFGNRYFTFGVAAGARGFGVFSLVYLGSLALNVAANWTVVTAAALLGFDRVVGLGAGFLAATAISATSNFFGMKLFVFRGLARGRRALRSPLA